uniref:Ycf1 n=1 Tax=Halochlorococcum sp. NIES-1838 TaxID=2249730 RepID=A0A2Z4MAL0_9CHLO|nr:Ycf1 [Halochlorococcum sp. NIES-1838]
MLFTNALKDYIDILDNLSSVFSDHFSVLVFVKSLFFYFVNSLKLVFVYLISFKWLTDFIELPALFKHQYVAILDGKNFFEQSFETELDKNFFLFLSDSSLNSKNFGTGFINSLFLALPFSVAHMLTIRAFLINGLPAGISAATGTIIGQTVFFSCILFGFEFLILPFLNFESITIILGLFILVNLFYKMIHRPNMAIISINQKAELLKLFGLNFVLAWTEQTCVFGYFGNLTSDGSSCLLQTCDSTTGFFLTQFLYLVGLVLGNICWTALFSFLVMSLRNLISNTIAATTSFISLNEKIHYFTLFVTAIFSFNNIPYYGFDYLFYNPLGFVSSDKALNNISPKIYYAVSMGSADSELTLNPLPFDKPYDKTTQPLKAASRPLKYEQYSLDSENLWKNKTAVKMPLGMSTSQKQITKPTRDLQASQFTTLSKYETNDLEQSPPFLSTKEQTIDHLLSKIFRNDVYLGYKEPTLDAGMTKVYRQFRERYYTNPVYKALVNIDMYPFLAGQPQNYSLTADDEFDLFKRRIILQNYLDSVQTYKGRVKKETESYAEKVYNQQFKGSLSLVRHFSAVNFKFSKNDTKLDDKVDPTIKKVLKYDQPLYNAKPQSEKGLLHEELETNVTDSSKFLMLNNSTPLYVGWDGALRKFLIKTASIPDQMKGGDLYNSMDPNNKFPSYFTFQAWSPAIENVTRNANTKFQLPSLDISDYDVSDIKNFLDLPKLSGKQMSNKIENEFVNESFIKKLPTFDWHWRQLELLTQKDSEQNLLIIEKAIPPRLDGIAWPGVENKNLLELLK